nr:glutamate-gated chloride channel subunit beta-like [Lepeophtheirus salmonis]
MLQDKKEPISVHIQFHLISINKIDESSGELEIRYFIQLNWKDSRIKFYHLFNDTERILTNEEKNNIWIPPLLFDNAAKSQYKFIEDHRITISARKEKYIIGTPNSVSFLSEKLHYNGIDVQLIYRTENNLNFFCTFNYLNYPFDSQTCKIFIGLPFDIKKKVELIVNTSTRIEPIHLVQYELSGLKFESTDNGVAVVHITLKRLFYNIFWITYLPTLFLQALTILTLYFPPNRFDFIIMSALTTMIVMNNLYQTLYSYLPLTGYNKMIDYWFIFSLTMPFFVFIIEVIIELSFSMSKRKMKNYILIYIVNFYGKNIVIISIIVFDVFYWIYNLDFYYN